MFTNSDTCWRTAIVVRTVSLYTPATPVTPVSHRQYNTQFTQTVQHTATPVTPGRTGPLRALISVPEV